MCTGSPLIYPFQSHRKVKCLRGRKKKIKYQGKELLNGKRVLEKVLSEWVLENNYMNENFCHQKDENYRHQERIEVKIKGTEAEIDTE